MKKAGSLQFITGFIFGAALFGSVVAAASNITAILSPSKVFVDGVEAKVEAYVIEGKNYFQLRDMAAAVGFEVEWDGENNRVLIDTGKGVGLSEQEPQPMLTATQTLPITKGIAYDRAPTSEITTTAEVTAEGIALEEPVAEQAKGGYSTVYKPLKTGDVVHTEPVETAVGSVGGDYEILRGAEERPWESDGYTWPDVPLPEWLEEWDEYDRVAIPNPAPVHFKGTRTGTEYDTLLVFNEYEVERMIRTIYKCAKINPSLWKDRDPSTNIPNFTITIIYEDSMANNTFFPWRAFEVENLVGSTFSGKNFRIYAFDRYSNGTFLSTEYFVK